MSRILARSLAENHCLQPYIQRYDITNHATRWQRTGNLEFVFRMELANVCLGNLFKFRSFEPSNQNQLLLTGQTFGAVVDFGKREKLSKFLELLPYLSKKDKNVRISLIKIYHRKQRKQQKERHIEVLFQCLLRIFICLVTRHLYLVICKEDL